MTAGIIPGFIGGNYTICPEQFGAVGDGVTNNYTAFTDLISYFNSYVGSRSVPGVLELTAGAEYYLGTSVTFPSDMTIRTTGGAYGGCFKPNTGVVVTIQGNIDCGKTRLFNLSSGGTSEITMAQKVRMEWWGTSSGTNDCLEHAINSCCPGCTILLSGVYIIGAPNTISTTNNKGLAIIGEGGPNLGGTTNLPVLYIANNQSAGGAITVSGGGSANLFLDGFKIYGNKANQTVNARPVTISGAGTSDIYVGHLVIEDAKDIGFYISSGENIFIDELDLYNNGSYGYEAQEENTDNIFINKIHAFNSGITGVWGLNRTNANQIVSHDNTSNGITSAISLYALINEAIVYKNTSVGFAFTSTAHDTYIGKLITYNNGTRGVSTGATSNNNRVGTVIGFDNQGTPTQDQVVYAVATSGSNNSVGEWCHDGNMVARSFHVTATGYNQILLGQPAFQSVSYAATLTPDPGEGYAIKVGTLTGNLTVNNTSQYKRYTGCKMQFLFIQDATGGRSITWDSAYKTTWSNSGSVKDLYASIEFTYDGTYWLQTDYVPWHPVT